MCVFARVRASMCVGACVCVHMRVCPHTCVCVWTKQLTDICSYLPSSQLTPVNPSRHAHSYPLSLFVQLPPF